MEPAITITLTQDEIQALGALLDAAVKATGIQGAKAAVPLYAKLEAAVAEANAPKSNVTPDFKGVPLNTKPQETE
jgi:hypothetical protein